VQLTVSDFVGAAYGRRIWWMLAERMYSIQVCKLSMYGKPMEEWRDARRLSATKTSETSQTYKFDHRIAITKLLISNTLQNLDVRW